MSTENEANLPDRANRPGLSQIKYRIGTHSAFLNRMIARLPAQTVTTGTRPLQELTTRDSDDTTLAFLDAWATALDVLSFYQERIANEGFIRSATERRSVLELARAIGYELKPGVAASVYLAFNVDEGEGVPEVVNVPRGSQALSIPGQDELPQTFETSVDFLARAEWNAFHSRLREDQSIASGTTEIYLAGTGTGLQSGDLLLIVGDEREASAASPAYAIRVLTRISADGDLDYTIAGWDAPLAQFPARPRVYAFRQRAALFGASAPEWLSLTQEERDNFVPTSLTTKAVAISPTGSANFVSGGGDGRIYRWNLLAASGETGLIGSFAGEHAGEVKSVAYAPDGTKVASGGADGSVRVWDPATGQQSQLFDNGGSGFTTAWTVAFSPDGTLLAAGFDSGVVRLWNTADWSVQPLGPASAHAGAVNSLAWQVDAGGTRLVSGGADAVVRVWDVANPSAAALFEYATGDQAIVLAVAATYDSSAVPAEDAATVLIADTKRRLTLWHYLRTGAAATQNFTVPDAAANSVAFPDGVTNEASGWPVRFLVGVAGGSLQEWFVHSSGGSVWPEIEVFDGHDQSVNSVAYYNDGAGTELVVSGGDDEMLRSNLSDYETERGFRVPLPPDYPDEWPNFANQDSRLDLDSVYPKVLAGSWVVVENAAQRGLYRVLENSGISRQDFLLNERITRLYLDTDSGLSGYGLRESTIFTQSEILALATEPIARTDVVAGDRMDLDRIVTDLETGRPLILSGKRSRLKVIDDVAAVVGEQPEIVSTDGARRTKLESGDILTILKSPVITAAGETIWSLESETGFVGTVTVAINLPADPFEIIAADPDDATVSEVAFLKNIIHSQKYSTLQFEEDLQYSYDRTTVTVQANVVPATHGESVEEILGSGDGSRVFQNFALKDPPLTYVSAPTQSGTETTLEIRVNDVLWEQSGALYELGSRDRSYVVRHEDDGSVHVQFGDGKSGERLPTGTENVMAKYRRGIGPSGEIAANRLRIVQNAPVGIADVDNPLPASGSSAPEPADEARQRAPFSVLTLGRIVSLKDFQDFARGFGGIGKARATSLWQEEVQLVYITIAGEGGATIDVGSELYINLGNALDSVRDPFQPVRIASFEPLYFNVAAKLLVDSRYLKERVFAAAEKVVREYFAFVNREFGQEVTVAELIRVLEAVDGVDAVDFDQLSLTTAALFNLDIEPNQALLENTSTIRESFRATFNALLTDFDATLTPLSDKTLVFEEKKGVRWVLREPDAEDGYAIIKERGSLNVYEYPARVTPFLAAQFARRDESGVFFPAQMLLLNSDAAGVILMEFTN